MEGSTEHTGGAGPVERPGPDSAALAGKALRERLAGLTANLNVAHCRLLRRIGELQRRGAGFEPGMLPFAHRRWGDGNRSHKLRAVTRVATPGNEPLRVNIARYATAAQLGAREIGVRWKLGSDQTFSLFARPLASRWGRKSDLTPISI